MYFVIFSGRNKPDIKHVIKTGRRGTSKCRLLRGARFHQKREMHSNPHFPITLYERGYRKVEVWRLLNGKEAKVADYLLPSTAWDPFLLRKPVGA